MKSSKEYYSEIYYSGVDRYFECKVRAQEYYIKKNNEKSSKGTEWDSYQFSYICYDSEKSQIQGPTAFNVRLPETDYVRLLTLQLYDKEGLTYNRILFIAPDIIQAIDKQVESSFGKLFQRDEMFEPIPGDEGKKWEEEDVIYLMETYGDGYCFDDAYICYIPEDWK